VAFSLFKKAGRVLMEIIFFVRGADHLHFPVLGALGDVQTIALITDIFDGFFELADFVHHSKQIKHRVQN